MREHGLAIESTDPAQSLHLPKVNVTDDPATIGPVDMVMFAVKLWDTESAARQLLPIMGPETGIISFQNGVQKDDMLRPIFGDKALMGGVAYVGTTIGRPGVIAQTGPLQPAGVRRIRRPPLARAPRRSSPPARRGGINAELSDDVRRSIWEKFVVLVAMSGATTSMRQTIGPIRANPLTREFLLDLAREVVAVGRAHGVNLPADYRRAAHSVLRRLAARDDHVDAPRPAGRAAARGALALGRRGRSRQAGRRADADEPRGARHPHAARRRARRRRTRIERDGDDASAAPHASAPSAPSASRCR